MIFMVRKCSTQYLTRTHKFELELLEMDKEKVAIDGRTGKLSGKVPHRMKWKY